MTNKIGQFIFWMSGLIGFAVFPSISALAKGLDPYIVVTELPEWMPGKPERSTQYVFWEGGQGQLSEIVQGRAVRVSKFTYGPEGKPSLIVDSVFAMEANYGAPKVPLRIVEGRGDRVVVVAHAAARTKFVTADKPLLPQPIVDLLQRVAPSAQSSPGEFVALHVLPESFAADLRIAGTVPSLSPAVLEKFPEMQEAVNTPYKLIQFSAVKWEHLRDGLNLKSPPFHIQLGDGVFAKLEFFR